MAFVICFTKLRANFCDCIVRLSEAEPPRADVESITLSGSRRGSHHEIRHDESDAHSSFEDPPILRHRRRSSSGDKSDRPGSANALLHNILPARRQLSQTHSEPDPELLGVSNAARAVTVERSVTWAEPRITVIPPASARNMLLALHSEYTR